MRSQRYRSYYRIVCISIFVGVNALARLIFIDEAVIWCSVGGGAEDVILRVR